MNLESAPYDSILFVSFGGPEGMDDVLPFLENVLRGKNVPHERMLEVAEHYRHFGGISPINEQNRQLIDAVRAELERVGIKLPVYWGNRNWHPLLPETLQRMRDDGCQKTIAFFTSMFSCYSGCRQYRENISEAQQVVGPGAPHVDKVRKGFNHPLFIAAQADLLRQALATLTDERRRGTRVLFTAHSIPKSMSDNSRYVVQLNEACRLVAEEVGQVTWELVYQSRSGPPQQPWLEPDICERIEQLADEHVRDVVIVPIGFISDHMEVLFDLDTEAKQTCEKLGMGCIRVPSVGTHPHFVRMICDLLVERIQGRSERPAIGNLGPSHDVCPVDCCLYPRPQRPTPVSHSS
jgi:protoporphyrin/coproporphyrin ferrochelatase